MPRRGFEAFVFPGKFLVDKIAEIKKHQQEQSRRKVTERELAHLHHKIDKLLVRLEEHEPEQAQTQDEECAICISAKATMQTFPCGHRVVCRKCFVKTIQMAVSQRLLPLRCVICRAKILRLKQLSPNKNSSSTPESSPTLAIPIGNSVANAAALHHYAASGKLPSWVGDSVQAIQRRHSAKRPLQRLERHQQQPTKENKNSSLCGGICGASVARSRFRQRLAAARSPLLLPIPETEELELVNSVQEQQEALCADFENEEEEDELLKAKKDLKNDHKDKIPLVKADHYQVVKWLSKIRRFRPPSILKGIRNRWKK